MTQTEPNNTSLPVIQLDADAYAEAAACVHCGLCLPACPTYTENRNEADSPRGRIYLMKGLADGHIQATDSVRHHLDLCLDCRACETACPSGVTYHKIIEPTREQLDQLEKKQKTASHRLVDWIFFNVFTKPTRLKLALLPPRISAKLGLWNLGKAMGDMIFSPTLKKMTELAPVQGPLWPAKLKARYPATTETRFTVGYLDGCIGSVIYGDVHRKAIAILNELGCDVHVPQSQGCCGAIHNHGGRSHDAKQMALNNIDAFKEVDFIVSDIAGCGAMLKEYDALFDKDDPQHAAAKEFTTRTRDICELIYELKPPKPQYAVHRVITYHDACHLAHGQTITAQPRHLLNMIEGLTLIPLPESELCCGAAGTYNLEQPEMAYSLGKRKTDNIAQTGAKTCVTGNVGCAMQIQTEGQRHHHHFDVAHTVELFYEAWFGPDTP